MGPKLAEPPEKHGPERSPKQWKPESAKDGIADEPTPKKRGPGRPRKQPLPEADLDGEEESHGAKAEIPKKRGPGRPRMSDSPGNGRPKKTSEQDDEADSQQPPKKKRGLGRPRKTSKKNDRDSDSSTGNDPDKKVSGSINLIRNGMDLAVDLMSKIKIGCRVEVFWSDDHCYYPGTITKQRANIFQAQKPFLIEYDDGYSEWIDLRDHVFRMIDSDCSNTSPNGPSSSASDAVAVSQGKRERERAPDGSFVKKHKTLKKN
jgi:hypothetical protein